MPQIYKIPKAKSHLDWNPLELQVNTLKESLEIQKIWYLLSGRLKSDINDDVVITNENLPTQQKLKKVVNFCVYAEASLILLNPDSNWNLKHKPVKVETLETHGYAQDICSVKAHCLLVLVNANTLILLLWLYTRPILLPKQNSKTHLTFEFWGLTFNHVWIHKSLLKLKYKMIGYKGKKEGNFCFWCRWRLNLRYFIQPSEILPVELIGTKKKNLIEKDMHQNKVLDHIK